MAENQVARTEQHYKHELIEDSIARLSLIQDFIEVMEDGRFVPFEESNKGMVLLVKEVRRDLRRLWNRIYPEDRVSVINGRKLEADEPEDAI